MGLFDGLLKKKKDLKLSENNSIYPKPNISLLRFEEEGGGFTTGWVNKSYMNYKNKSNYPFCFSFIIDLTDEIAEKNEDLDMFSIEEFFREEMTKIGISHMIARRATEIGMDILMYMENANDTKEYLDATIKSPNRKFSFSYEITEDPEWEAASYILEM